MNKKRTHGAGAVRRGLTAVLLLLIGLLAGAQAALPQSDSGHIRSGAKVALGSGYAAFFPPR